MSPSSYEPNDPLPETDPVRWEGLVRSIVDGAGPELQRRREPKNVLAVLDQWRRPAVPLVSVLAAALFAGLILIDRNELNAASQDATLVEALVPTPIAAWFVDEYEMEPHELIAALGEVTQ